MQFIYLIISIYFGRKNPLFFLIFPLALIQGPGAFIDTRTVLVSPEYFLYGKNIFKDIIIFYLIAVVLYLSKKVNFKIIMKTPMKWYFSWILFLTIFTLFSYGTDYESIAVIRIFIYMVLGYYLLILIFSATRYDKFQQFLNVLFVINVVQSILYVLNSSNALPVFDHTLNYNEIDDYSQSFLRDFATIPLFSNLFFIYGLTLVLIGKSKIKKIVIYACLVTYPFVLLYSFTRSLLIITMIEIIIVICVLAIKKPMKILKPKVLFIIFGAILLFSLSKLVLNKETDYFNKRIQGAVNEGKDETDVDVRIRYHDKAWNLVSQKNAIWTGYALNKKLEPKMAQVGAWAADSTIPFLLIFTGVIGVLIYYMNQIYFLFLSMKNNYLGLNALTIALNATLLSSIISSLFMGGNSWGNPLIFFNFVLIVFLNNNYSKIYENKEKVLLNNKFYFTNNISTNFLK